MPEKLRDRRERLAKAAVAEKADAAAPVAGGKKGRERVSKSAKTRFTTQLATLQDAGLPILRSLKILEAQLEPGPMKRVVVGLTEDVEGGASLSEAMSKYPYVFDDLYVNLVRAGEAGGALTQIFNRLAEFMEKAEALTRKIRSAMIYPTLVVGFAILVIVYIMVSVVPRFEDAFRSLGGKLPAPTQFLIDTSRFLADRWWVLLLGVAAVVGIVVAVGRSAGGRRFFDRMKMRVPVFGPIVHGTQIARFSRTLGTLSASGVERLRSLDIVADSAGNVIFEDGVRVVQTAVREGESMARPMGETKLFDDVVVNMVDVGEETGELDKMLLKVADVYEAQVDNRVGALMSILEPVLIVVLGLVVGFIVVALFLPLLSIQDLLGK
jgi:type IV pilus assembly protein PilC